MEHAFLCLHCNDNVFSYGKISNDTFCLTIFRKICHTQLHGIQRTVDFYFFTIYLQCTTVSFVSSVNGTYQFRTSGSQKTGKTDNLSFINLKIKWPDRSLMSNTLSLNDRSFGEYFFIFVIAFNVCKIIKILTHHLGNQHNSWKIFGLIFSNQLTISKNRDPVTHCIYLLQEMCYEDDSNTFLTKSAHQNKQFLNFFIIQRGSRLIQDQNLTFHIHSTCDRDHLLDRYRTFIQHLCRRNINVQAFQKLCRTCIHFFPVDHSNLVSRLTANKQVFRNSQVRTEVYFLVNRADSICLCLLRRMIDNVFIFTIHMNGTAFEFMYTGQNFDQC